MHLLSCSIIIMERALQSIESFPCIHDIIVFLNNWTDHLKYLDEVLQAMHKAGFTVNSGMGRLKDEVSGPSC